MTTGIMEVTVVGARDLKNTELFGQGRRPVWDEKFRFRVKNYPPESQLEDESPHKLSLKIMDRDSFTDDDYLGQATIYLKELFLRGLENGKAEIRTQKYRVVSNNQTYHGEIRVGVTFTAVKTNKQESGGRNESQL